MEGDFERRHQQLTGTRRYKLQTRGDVRQFDLLIMNEGPETSRIKQEQQLVQKYLDIPGHLLKRSKVSNINVKVGSGSFVVWFLIWTYLPIVTACVAPLSNMLSIAALVTHWRGSADGPYQQDEVMVYVLNSVSLASGSLANLFLIMNFGKRIQYKVSQPLSITFFFIASIILLSALVVAQRHYYHDDHYYKTEGFWFAVLTCILYFLCSFTCMVNFLGYFLSKYPPDFNLDRSERALVVYTFLLAIWFVWGAALFNKLMSISYGNAMYFCVVSVLTLGFGDNVPTTTVGKALALVYSLTGLIILGLIIAMIRTIVVQSASPVMFWNAIEERRAKLLQKVQKEHLTMEPEEAFDLMRSIRRRSRKYKRNISSLGSLIVFAIFWLLGAMVFYFTEKWSYFNAVYFTLLSLMTIGYGDYTPKSAAGRCFFILWALLAVPMMTALISSVGDTLYHWAMVSASSRLIRFLFRKTKPTVQNTISFPGDEEDSDDDGSDDDNDNETRSVDEIIQQAKYRKRKFAETNTLVKTLGKLMREARDSPKKKYTFDDWNSLIQSFDDTEAQVVGANKPDFWISDKSPLRYPIDEPSYLTYMLFDKLQTYTELRLLELEEELQALISSRANSISDNVGDSSSDTQTQCSIK